MIVWQRTSPDYAVSNCKCYMICAARAPAGQGSPARIAMCPGQEIPWFRFTTWWLAEPEERDPLDGTHVVRFARWQELGTRPTADQARAVAEQHEADAETRAAERVIL